MITGRINQNSRDDDRDRRRRAERRGERQLEMSARPPRPPFVCFDWPRVGRPRACGLSVARRRRSLSRQSARTPNRRPSRRQASRRSDSLVRPRTVAERRCAATSANVPTLGREFAVALKAGRERLRRAAHQMQLRDVERPPAMRSVKVVGRRHAAVFAHCSTLPLYIETRSRALTLDSGEFRARA